VRLDEDNGFGPALLIRLTLRTEHRDADGVQIMIGDQLVETIELDRLEREGKKP
jgi:hypothetical protein